jgi:hypothetical protein
MTISQEQFVDDRGAFCPGCGSSAVKVGSFHESKDSILRGCICLSCSAGWCEDYKITGFSEFEAGDTVEEEIDDSIRAGCRAKFDYCGSAKHELKMRDEQIVTVGRKLTQKENQSVDNDPMFYITFSDGFEFTAFEYELTFAEGPENDE